MKIKYSKIIFILILAALSICLTACSSSKLTTKTTTKTTTKYLPKNLEIVKAYNKYGLKDETGKIILKPIYDRIQKTSYGLFVIIRNNKLGLIDNTGKVLIMPKYEANLLEYNFEFSDGLAAVVKKTKDKRNNCVYIDKTGKEILDPTNYGYSTVQDETYGSCSQFSEGLAPAYVLNKFNYYGYINKAGTMIIKLKGVDECGDTMCMSDFDNGVASVNINGKQMYINIKGEIINKTNVK